MRRLSNGYVTPITTKHPRALRFEREIKPTYADVSERFKVSVLKTDVRQHRGFKSYHPRQPLWIDEGINSDLRIAQPREKRIVYTLVIEVVDAYAIVQKNALCRVRDTLESVAGGS